MCFREQAPPRSPLPPRHLENPFCSSYDCLERFIDRMKNRYTVTNNGSAKAAKSAMRRAWAAALVLFPKSLPQEGLPM